MQQPIVALLVVVCLYCCSQGDVFTKMTKDGFLIRQVLSFYISLLFPNHIWSALQQYWDVTSDCLISIWGKIATSVGLCWDHISDIFPQWITSPVIQNSRKVNKIMNNSIKREFKISLFHLMLFDWYCMWSLVWWKNWWDYYIIRITVGLFK